MFDEKKLPTAREYLEDWISKRQNTSTVTYDDIAIVIDNFAIMANKLQKINQDNAVNEAYKKGFIDGGIAEIQKARNEEIAQISKPMSYIPSAK